jgi:hypothetical protein
MQNSGVVAARRPPDCSRSQLDAGNSIWCAVGSSRWATDRCRRRSRTLRMRRKICEEQCHPSRTYIVNFRVTGPDGPVAVESIEEERRIRWERARDMVGRPAELGAV